MKKANILVYAPAVVNKVRIEKLRGIIAYAKRNDLPWEFVHTGPNFYEQSNLRRSLKEADAVISHTTDENEIELIRAQNLPWISLAFPGNLSNIFLVTDDDQSIGEMAAEHLLQHRVKTLLFVGPQTLAGKARAAGFAENVTRSEITVKKIFFEPAAPFRAGLNRLKRALKSIEKPIGIFGYNDTYAFHAEQTARESGFKPVQEILVIGCDNDETICEISSLTSIAANGIKTGEIAAQQLHKLLQNKTIDPWIAVPPSHVVARKSTRKWFTVDPIVNRAIDAIEQNLTRNFSVKELVALVPYSRRNLEYHFRQELQRTPREIILELQSEAKGLR